VTLESFLILAFHKKITSSELPARGIMVQFDIISNATKENPDP